MEKIEVEAGVIRQRREHVVEETDSRGHGDILRSVDRVLDSRVSLLRGSTHRSLAVTGVLRTLIHRSIASIIERSSITPAA